MENLKEIKNSQANEAMGDGLHDITWDGRKHPNGVYFYDLVTNEFSETRKMILLK